MQEFDQLNDSKYDQRPNSFVAEWLSGFCPPNDYDFDFGSTTADNFRKKGTTILQGDSFITI